MLKSSLFVRRLVGIICEKLIYVVEIFKKKFLERGVSQMIRPIIYKSLVQFSYPISLFLSIICLFPLCLNHFFTLILFSLLIMMLTHWLLLKIVLKNCFFNDFFKWTQFFKLMQFISFFCVWNYLSNKRFNLLIVFNLGPPMIG